MATYHIFYLYNYLIESIDYLNLDQILIKM